MSIPPKVTIGEDGNPYGVGQFVSDGGRPEPLTLDEYQENCTKFALYPGQGSFIGLAYAILGLNGEAGETGEQVKKTWRDDAADIEASVKAVVHGLQACDVSHGLNEEDYAKAIERIEDAFKVPLTEERRQKIVKELGDCLWYASQVATEIGVSLGDIAQANIDKLAARRAANLIHGEGSDR